MGLKNNEGIFGVEFILSIQNITCAGHNKPSLKASTTRSLITDG